MGAKKDKFLIAIDTITDEEEEPVEIPDILGKLLRKHGNDIGLKVIILWSKDSLKNKFFDSKVLEKCRDRIDIVSSRSLMIFKIGIAMGKGIHTLLYSSSKDEYSSWMKDVYTDLKKNDSNQEKELGLISILRQRKLWNFDPNLISKLEDEYDELICPEKFELETKDTKYESWIEDIWEKLAKQFNKIEKMDISKFTNTWQNIITQHLNSSTKSKSINNSKYKKYMLSWVLQKLLSEEFVSNKILNNIAWNIYESKEIIEWWNVEINESFQSKYNKTLTKLETYNLSDDTTSTASTIFSKSKSSAQTNSIDDRSTERSDTIFTAELSNLGYEDSDLSRIKTFIIAKFLIKYEQSNYANIRKPAKFINAVGNFVAQTLESKQFNKTFRIEEKEGMQDKVIFASSN